MDNAEFKKIVRKKLTEAGFVYRNKNYYYSTEDLIAVIDLQKSNFSDSWYINYGFFVKSIHENNSYPKVPECDVDARFFNEAIAVNGGAFSLSMTHEEIRTYIQDELNHIILPVLQKGIEEFFHLVPKGECLAKKRLKDYLGIEY